MTSTSEIITSLPLSGRSRKEKRRREDRQDILRAARTLFATSGFDNTTLDEIAHTAGFGKGTLYSHFANKEDILQNILRLGFQSLSDEIERVMRSQTDPVDQLRATIRTILAFFESKESLFRIFVTERRRLLSGSAEESRQEFMLIFEKITGQVERILASGVSAAALRSMDTKAAAYLVLGAVNSQVHCWLQNGAQGSLSEKAAFLEEALLSGLKRA